MEFEWTIDAEDVVPGKATPVTLDTTVTVSENSRSISGDGLWKLSIFGSRTETPDDEDRFGLVKQTLNPAQAGTELFSGRDLTINNVETMFDIGSIGCTDYEYVCLEFTKGDDPVPEYSFRVGEQAPEEEGVRNPLLGPIDWTGNAADQTDTLVSCKPQKCNLSKLMYFPYVNWYSFKS